MKTMEEEEEEEQQRMICKVVKYVEPLMGKELLSKFPDNSAFDFDYSQSSIWSPLVPRPYHYGCMNVKPISLSMSMEITPPSRRKQSCVSGLMNKSITTNIKKKIANTSLNINLNLVKMKKKMKHKGSDFSPNPPPFKPISTPTTSTKGWNKVLKAASNQFKKKKKDPMVHVRLSNYLRDENF